MATLPETNITTTLVGNTIGNSSRNVGVLCTAPTINKWSRKKPVISVGSPNWWEAADGKFSLTVNTAPIASLEASGTWAYNKPTGVYPTSGYRLGDFRGYNHAATATIRFEANSETPAEGSEVSGIDTSVHFFYNRNVDGDGITPSDLGFGNYYFGIRLSWTEGTTEKAYFITISNVVSDTTRSIIVANMTQNIFNGLTNGTEISWAAFLSDTIIGSYDSEDPSDSTWVTIPSGVNVIRFPNITDAAPTNGYGTFSVLVYGINSIADIEIEPLGETINVGVTSTPTLGEWTYEVEIEGASNLASLTLADANNFSKITSGILEIAAPVNSTSFTASVRVTIIHSVDTNKTEYFILTQAGTI